MLILKYLQSKCRVCTQLKTNEMRSRELHHTYTLAGIFPRPLSVSPSVSNCVTTCICIYRWILFMKSENHTQSAYF